MTFFITNLLSNMSIGRKADCAVRRTERKIQNDPLEGPAIARRKDQQHFLCGTYMPDCGTRLLKKP